MPVPLSHALASPALASDVVCELLCPRCQIKQATPVRGIAVSADLAPLGDVGCAQCGGIDGEFLPIDLELIALAMRQLIERRIALPSNTDAFLRSGAFLWRAQRYEDPRVLRLRLEAHARDHRDDSRGLLEAAAGMVEVRAFIRGLELAGTAMECSPASPDPILLLAEIASALADHARAEDFARKALARKDGPLLLLADASRVVTGTAEIIQLANAARRGEAAAATARNEACACGSGKMFRQCCGAPN